MKYFTEEEIIEQLIDTLEWYSGYYCDLHNEVFNSDYYIIGTYEAKKALEEYGVFEAIEKIQEYEVENFGELYTDISDPERVANMLYYLLAEEFMYGDGDFQSILSENWNRPADEETNEEMINILRELLEEEE